jgi:hypothetical protein
MNLSLLLLILEDDLWYLLALAVVGYLCFSLGLLLGYIWIILL